tara:strand:- start:138 stop:830 length:693 start_codon:yes stop_codon:yes gene_type:complete
MLLEIIELVNYTYEPQQGILPIVVAGLVAQGVAGAVALHKANKSKGEAKGLKDQLENLENSRQEVLNSKDDILALKDNVSNPYENLPVAVEAAKMQIEEADQSLANTLDAMRSGGFGAGGATALARAAADSKKGMTASIEQQEANNAQLRAQGEQAKQSQLLQLDQAAIQADQDAWQQEENRELMALDRAQAELDNKRAQQMQFQSDAMGAFTGMASSMVTAGIGAPGKD